MPQNTPYPGETPDDFIRRLMGKQVTAPAPGFPTIGEALIPSPPTGIAGPLPPQRSTLPRLSPPGSPRMQGSGMNIPGTFKQGPAPRPWLAAEVPEVDIPNEFNLPIEGLKNGFREPPGLTDSISSMGGSIVGKDERPWELGPLGRMGYEGPQLNTQQALAGLAGGPEHPLLQLTRLGSEFRTGQRPGSPSYQRGQDISGYVDEQLAPQRQQLGGVESAITAMHPAVQAVQELEAQRKAYPQAAYGEGLAEQAEIGAEADIQQAMIEAAAGNVESLRELLPPALKGLVDIAGGPDPDSPQAKQAWDLIWSFVTHLGQQGAI